MRLYARENRFAQATYRSFAAALSEAFGRALCEAAGVKLTHPVKDLFKPATRKAIEAFLASQTRAQLDKLATAKAHTEMS